MEQYLINDTSLIGIGDALRRKHGETSTFYREEVVPSPPVISKTSNALSFTERNGGYGNFTEFYDVVHIEGAHTIKVKMAYETESPTYDWVQVASGELTSMPSTATKYGNKTIKQIELEFPDTDTITFYFKSDVSNDAFLGYYAECTGYDADGNPATYIIQVPYEVPNEYKPSEMAAAIDAINTTTESIEIDVNGTYTPSEGVLGFNSVVVNTDSIPEESMIFSGDCNYKFAYNNWNWFINTLGDKIQGQNLKSTNYMFYESNELEAIPFTLTAASETRQNLNTFFVNCRNLKIIPKMLNFKPSETNGMFQGCQRLREIPEDFCDTWDWSYLLALTDGYSGSRGAMFNTCHSLRKFPMNLLKYSNPYASSSYSIYYQVFNNCHALDEIIDLPIPYTPDKISLTGSYFNYSFYNCNRLKNLTFETNEDGSPIVVNWKNQNIDLTSVGQVNNFNISVIINYNSGITEDKQVKDDATYAALKNDPDWYTNNVPYSRYNRISAINTINSLPDASAYLASAGGTNTIKFKGAAGEKTDGGAINTLTAEEIAVATAKGWTVSLA